MAIDSFVATFRLLIGGGTGADGASFAFGNLPNGSWGEEGPGVNGLVVRFDTFNNIAGDFASEIDEAWLEGVETVGLTSGASVPEVLVEEVLAWLGERGYADVEIVKTAEESITFSLPKELRRDLRAEAAELVADE